MRDQGIGQTYIRPATPRLNGEVERSHRIDAEEFYWLLDGVLIDDAGAFNDKLREWEDYYARPTAASADRRPTRDCYRRERPSPSPTNVSTTASAAPNPR